MGGIFEISAPIETGNTQSAVRNGGKWGELQIAPGPAAFMVR